MIGAIVLTALAIIILPMLLDGSAEDRARVIARIPEPPAIELKRLTVADIDAKMNRMEAQSAASMPKTSAPPISTPTSSATPGTEVAGTSQSGSAASNQKDTGAAVPEVAAADNGAALDEDNLPISWSLQLGSFKHPENALKLRAQLREASYKAYILQARTDEGEMYRVLVGPMLQKNRLADIGQQIESKFDLKGQIVRYNIAEDKGQLGG